MTYTISGTVTSGGNPLASVVMSGLPGNPQTNAQGQYTATVNHGWSGTVTPTLAGYTFTPASTTYTNVTSNQTTNYTSTVVTYTISGTVTSGGNPLPNVVMNGLPGGNPQTNSQGQYTATVNYGWSGTATPTLAGYTFTPPSTNYSNVTSNQTTSYPAVIVVFVPTVTTTAITSITSTSGMSGGNVTSDGGAAVTLRGVCWSTSANPTIADPHTSDGTETGSYISNITGLTPNTPYHVRAYATNSAGTGYGTDLSFTTAAPSNLQYITVRGSDNWLYIEIDEHLRGAERLDEA